VNTGFSLITRGDGNQERLAEMYPHIVLISPEIVHLEIVYSVCEINTLAEVYKSAILLKNLDSRFFSDLHSFYEI